MIYWAIFLVEVEVSHLVINSCYFRWIIGLTFPFYQKTIILIYMNLSKSIYSLSQFEIILKLPSTIPFLLSLVHIAIGLIKMHFVNCRQVCFAQLLQAPKPVLDIFSMQETISMEP